MSKFVTCASGIDTENDTLVDGGGCRLSPDDFWSLGFKP